MCREQVFIDIVLVSTQLSVEYARDNEEGAPHNCKVTFGDTMSARSNVAPFYSGAWPKYTPYGAIMSSRVGASALSSSCTRSARCDTFICRVFRVFR